MVVVRTEEKARSASAAAAAELGAWVKLWLCVIWTFLSRKFQLLVPLREAPYNCSCSVIFLRTLLKLFPNRSLKNYRDGAETLTRHFIPSIARCYSTSHTLGTKSTKMFSVVESCQGVLRIGIGKMVKQKILAKMEG